MPHQDPILAQIYVRLKEDRSLMQYVNDHRIALEICLTSNYQTKSIRSLKYHPLKFYHDQGIRVTLNTDNRQPL